MQFIDNLRLKTLITLFLQRIIPIIPLKGTISGLKQVFINNLFVYRLCL